MWPHTVSTPQQVASCEDTHSKMDLYLTLFTVLGLVILLTAWLPMLIKELPLSLPIVCIALGAGLVISPFSPIVGANPLENRALTERLTEFVVIVSLAGAGLKLDRQFGWRSWKMTWRPPSSIRHDSARAGRSSSVSSKVVRVSKNCEISAALLASPVPAGSRPVGAPRPIRAVLSFAAAGA